MDPPRINIAETLAEVVRNSGGIVLDDRLPQARTFDNADYVFHAEGMVADLKCLTAGDLVGGGEPVIAGQGWPDRTRLEGRHGFGDSRRRMGELSPDSRSRFHQTGSETVRRHIRLADARIRETKRALRLADYQGLVMLANDGVYSLSPAMVIQAARQVMADEASGIQCFVYLTANLFTNHGGAPVPALFWIGFDLRDGTLCNSRFVDRLGWDWRSLVCRKTRIPGFHQEPKDMESFWGKAYRR